MTYQRTEISVPLTKKSDEFVFHKDLCFLMNRTYNIIVFYDFLFGLEPNGNKKIKQKLNYKNDEKVNVGNLILYTIN